MITEATDFLSLIAPAFAVVATLFLSMEDKIEDKLMFLADAIVSVADFGGTFGAAVAVTSDAGPCFAFRLGVVVFLEGAIVFAILCDAFVVVIVAATASVNAFAAAAGLVLVVAALPIESVATFLVAEVETKLFFASHKVEGIRSGFPGTPIDCGCDRDCAHHEDRGL